MNHVSLPAEQSRTLSVTIYCLCLNELDVIETREWLVMAVPHSSTLEATLSSIGLAGISVHLILSAVCRIGVGTADR